MRQTRMLIEQKAKNRMDSLYSQPHDDEWDSPYDELEYFLLKKLTQPIYEEYKDDFIVNPIILNCTKKDMILFLNEISLNIINNQDIKINENNEKENQFKTIIKSVIDNYKSVFQNFGSFGINDVICEGLIYFLERYESIDYDHEEYSSAFFYNDINPKQKFHDMEEKLYIGYIKNKKNISTKTFFYFKNNNFITSEVNHTIVHNAIAWKEIEEKDLNDYIIYRQNDNIEFSRIKEDFDKIIF